MDAKITKSRLGNFLAYDWLKIILFVVIAVFALWVLFTSVATRPRDDQQYEIYGYLGLEQGGDGISLSDRLAEEKCFSYDVLDVTFEVFNDKQYGSAAYTARRAAGQGKAMFVAGQNYTLKDQDGVEHTENYLNDFVSSCISGEGETGEQLNPLFDLPAFMSECEEYLTGVFGETWRENNVPDEARVKELFLARNDGDKRFRSATKKEAGIAMERERLLKLREDYLSVSAALEEGTISYKDYLSKGGKTYTVALNVGGLARLSNLVYYNRTTEEGKTERTAEDVYLVLFYNGEKSTDLKFEGISFIRWLVENYGAQEEEK